MGMWDEAFSVFCEGLGSNNTLTHLDLRNNQISHQGASELALALKKNSTVEDLGKHVKQKLCNKSKDNAILGKGTDQFYF